MDLGFSRAGFHIAVANEYDPAICPTYRRNHPDTKLVEGDICSLDAGVLPAGVCGVIGGPPCQSWSAAGAKRGIRDPRGRLFYEYIRVISAVRPEFFVAENVPGMLAARNAGAVEHILRMFTKAGYRVRYRVLNANGYGVPQDRSRVFYVGFRDDIPSDGYAFPSEAAPGPTLRDAIWDLRDSALPAPGNRHRTDLSVPNHEYYVGGFSPIYMSRNRVRAWDEPAFTVQASGRQCQCHPQAPKMVRAGVDLMAFDPSVDASLYRRLTVRECARVQTFPDSFEFVYSDVDMGYKMVGNAVPVNLAYAVALSITNFLGGER
jgi:DNA (cytosine-5)-methyltransferase 1